MLCYYYDVQLVVVVMLTRDKVVVVQELAKFVLYDIAYVAIVVLM